MQFTACNVQQHLKTQGQVSKTTVCLKLLSMFSANFQLYRRYSAGVIWKNGQLTAKTWTKKPDFLYIELFVPRK